MYKRQDVDGDLLTVTGVGNASGGTVVLVGSTITFTPTSGYSGAASFTYDVSDGNGGTASETVSLTVDALTSNTPPTGVADTYGLDEDGALSVLAATGVLANDTDTVGDVLSATLLSDVSDGTLSLAADGGFSYTPNADFNGTDSFTYTVTDSAGATDTATVTLNIAPVNDAPVTVGDGAQTIQGEPVVIDVLANDGDIEDGFPNPTTVQIEAADDATGLVKTVIGEGIWLSLIHI